MGSCSCQADQVRMSPIHQLRKAAMAGTHMLIACLPGMQCKQSLAGSPLPSTTCTPKGYTAFNVMAQLCWYLSGRSCLKCGLSPEQISQSKTPRDLQAHISELNLHNCTAVSCPEC